MGNVNSINIYASFLRNNFDHSFKQKALSPIIALASLGISLYLQGTNCPSISFSYSSSSSSSSLSLISSPTFKSSTILTLNPSSSVRGFLLSPG
jgi:hypothetical protein